MGSASRRKGANGEREAARLLPSATKISGMYLHGPDLQWLDRYVEVKRRRDAYQSLNTAAQYLDDDAGIYMTRLDRKPWLMILHRDTMLDMIGEAWDRGRAGLPMWGDVQ